MKQLAYLVMVLMLLFSFSTGQARDTRLKVSIEEALQWGEREGVLRASISLYFGEQEYPAVEQELGTYTSNKKTNGVGKSDQEACQWAFLTAIKSPQARAAAEGGDAVVDIHSYYKRDEFSSATDFECGAGTVMSGVTMIGTVVKLAK
jgi:hypothetical protein